MASVRGLLARRPIIVWTLAAWVPMLVWFAAFRPGFMSADSIEIWRQAVEGGWSDLQAPAYTAAMAVSAKLLDSPSLLVLGQQPLLAFALVSVAAACVRIGANRRVVLVVTAVVACTPMVGAFSITLWKDVPFTAAVVLIGARLVDLARGRLIADQRIQRTALRGVAVWAVLATLMRQNGILLVAAIFLVLVIVLAGLRVQALLGLLTCVAALAGLKLIAQPALDVTAGPANSSIATMLHDIASVAARDGTALDPGDVALLETVAPLEQWTTWWESYTCRSADWQWQPAFQGWGAVDGHQGEFVELWAELSVENPRAVIGNRLCVGAVAWRPDNAGTLYTVSRGIDPNRFGLETRPLIGGLTEPLRDVLDWLDERPVQWFFWRAPLWIYLAYTLVGVTAWRRRAPALLLPLVPLVALQVTVGALNPAQDARYMLPGLLLAVLVLPLVTFRPPEPATTEEASDDDRRTAPGADPGALLVSPILEKAVIDDRREPEVPRPTADAASRIRPVETDAG